MSDNFTQLQTDITDIMASSDINTTLCIKLAEKDLNRRLRLQAMLTKTAVTVALTGDRYIGALPSDFLEAFHVEQGGYRLNYYGPADYWHQKDKIYTIMGTDIHVTGSTDVDLWYYGEETALSVTNQTNNFTVKCYDGLLMLACAHAYWYQDNFEKAAVTRSAAFDLLSATQSADEAARRSGAPLVQR